MTDLLDERMDQRLSDAARRWRAEQAPPVSLPLERLSERLPRRPRWRVPIVAAASAVVVAVGGMALFRPGGSAGPSDDGSNPPSSAPVTDDTRAAEEVVPFRALKPGHPHLGHRVHGHLVTPYDGIVASGHIGGTFHPGDMLTFVVRLESDHRVSLHPCPDYTIVFGRKGSITRRLNCAQVPYYASIPNGHGGMTAFRTTLPANTPVAFRMQIKVPDEHGPQKVLWVLDGPQQAPGFYGIVRVTPR